MRDLLNKLDTILTEAVNPDIRQVVVQAGYETKINGNLMAALVQIPDGQAKTRFRTMVLNDLLNRMQQAFPDLQPAIGSDAKISSLGYIGFQGDPTKIVVKDQGIQGEKSAGVANEAELASLLQSMIEKYQVINVTFRDERGKTLEIKDVTQVELTGKDVKDRKKADVVLKSATQRLPVSLKKLDAETWESADTMFGAKAREIIDRLVDDGAVTLTKISDKDGYKLSKEIVVEPTEQEAMSAIFGQDINPEGGIVIQTFRPEHFVQDGNSVIIDAHAVIKTREDIPESHLMVWLIRNNAGRLSKSLGIRGLRPMASVLTRALGRRGDKDVVLVDKNGNVVERKPRDTAAKIDTDNLDAVSARRLTGPGARKSREREPDFSPKTTGRARRGSSVAAD